MSLSGLNLIARLENCLVGYLIHVYHLWLSFIISVSGLKFESHLEVFLDFTPTGNTFYPLDMVVYKILPSYQL